MDYVNNIKSTTLETVNRDKSENDETVDEALLWEMIQLQIEILQSKTQR